MYSVCETERASARRRPVLRGPAAGLRRGDRIIVSAVEHSSVYESAKRLAELGWDVQYTPVDESGVVNIEALKALLTERTVLVSVMTVNNETGAVMPIERIAKLVHKNCPEALFHTDATQAIGKMPFDAVQLDVDAASFSAHKICGPKGVGALFLKARTPFDSQMVGGGQEGGRRSTTQNVCGIVGFAAACHAAVESLDAESARQRGLRDKLYAELSQIDIIQ